jgi:hypothetical protein
VLQIWVLCLVVDAELKNARMAVFDVAVNYSVESTMNALGSTTWVPATDVDFFEMSMWEDFALNWWSFNNALVSTMFTADQISLMIDVLVDNNRVEPKVENGAMMWRIVL